MPTTCGPASSPGSSTSSRTKASSATTRGLKATTRSGGGGHNWSEFTVDEENGIAFIGFGSPRYDFYGGDRKGNNLFANSLVALDARTGKRLWHHQLIHHDLWDWDIPQSAKLLTIRQNGKPRQVVAQATKQGFLYVFDRRSGQPIWPIEERPVPQTDVPGEWSSPTQPFPTRPAPFAKQSFTEKDINPYLPKAAQDDLRARLRSYRNEGLFTPPSIQGSVQMPGHNGGANFGTSAVDPDRGEFYIVHKSLPTMIRIALPAGARGAGGWRRPRRRHRHRHARTEGGADARPPGSSSTPPRADGSSSRRRSAS